MEEIINKYIPVPDYHYWPLHTCWLLCEWVCMTHLCGEV